MGDPPSAVLQWVNPIFDPAIHEDIDRVTRRLLAQGLRTPRLRRTVLGELCLVDPEAGTWRVMDFIPGRTFHRLDQPARAAEAGRLVGRFHAALADWAPQSCAPRRDIHDTPARMAELRRALDAAGEHPLAGPARELGVRILDAWAAWDGPLDLPERTCHGDLKISNVRFDEAGERAICLIDLDTVGPLSLSCELGDAWRSWCNPAGEDDPERVRFDFALFEASARAFLEAGPPLDPEERQSLVPGIERICLELAARFCADVVNNDYFREDRHRFPIPGEHNLVRARSQFALAKAARERRADCERVVM